MPNCGDGGGAADGREIALVDVVEIAARFAAQLAADVTGGGATFLHGDGCDAGNHLSTFIFERGQVADDEDFGMAGDAQVRIHQHPAGAVDRRSQLLAQGRCGDSRCP